MTMIDPGGAPPMENGGQQSQEEASYRHGNPIKHCGICVHYKGGSCEVVEGDINPYMVSNEFDPWRPNPLHSKGVHFYLKGNEVWRKNREARREETGKGTRGQAKQAKDKPSKLRIGKQTYD